MNSINEWDPLEEIIIGIADYANWPTEDPVFAEEANKTLWTETPVPSGPVPQWIIDEANEDLNALARICTEYGAVVKRPETMDFQHHGGLYNYCPRDRFLVYGDKVVNPAMMYPCRDMEYQCYEDMLKDAGDIIHMPRNDGMILDAANVCRLGDSMLFLESASGNRKAYEWLCEKFPNTNIELCNFYAGVHIDSTIVPLREGLVLLNGARVTDDTCPEVFKNWDKIYVNDVVPQGFYEYPYASKWIAMNMLVLDPHTVIVDKYQVDLIRTLEQRSFTVIPSELRHSRTLGGGFHCVTLDTRRKHG